MNEGHYHVDEGRIMDFSWTLDRNRTEKKLCIQYLEALITHKTNPLLARNKFRVTLDVYIENCGCETTYIVKETITDGNINEETN